MIKYILLFVLSTVALSGYAVDVDQQAPSVELPTLVNNVAGKPSSLDAYRGKLIYLDFWASWCGPCRQSFPFLTSLKEKYADQGFEIIAVNVDAQLSDAIRFLKKYPVNYPVLLDPNGVSMAALYNIRGLPTSFIINQNGAIVYEHLGFKEHDKAWITALIEENLNAH